MKINKDLEKDIKDRKIDIDDPDVLSNKNLIDELKMIFSIKKIAICLVSIALLLIFLSYICHLILPIKARWLLPEDIEKIRSMAISIIVGIISCLISMLFSKNR